MASAYVVSELRKIIIRRKGDFFYVNGDNIKCIVRNLKFVYDSVIATVELLSCAIKKLKEEESSPFRDQVLSYFIEHLEEERDHAGWLADDLVAHGVKLSSPDEDAMFMIGAQYYLVNHYSPYYLLGYMAVVEGTPTPIGEIEKLERVYGKKLFRFSRFHSVKDEEHKDILFRNINEAPAQHIESIFRSANITLDCMAKASVYWR